MEATRIRETRHSRGRRSRPLGAYWPIVAVALAGLFLGAPGLSLWLRAYCVVIVVAFPWAGFRFAEAISAGRPRSARGRAVPAPSRTSLALALPGILGCLAHLASFAAFSFHPPREDRYVVAVIWVGLAALLLLASVCGLAAALDRTGRFRLLAIVVNGAYALSTALIFYWVLQPVS